MKNIIISADGDRFVYSVPDEVADNLSEYCDRFREWIYNDPAAEIYLTDDGVFCYDETDFIKYIARLFPDERPVFTDNLGPSGIDAPPIPEKYKDCNKYNF